MFGSVEGMPSLPNISEQEFDVPDLGKIAQTEVADQL